MANWNRFWELMDEEIPAAAIKPANESIGIYGEYVEGQVIKEWLNQITRECGLDWRVDWSAMRAKTFQRDHRYFAYVILGDLVIFDSETGTEVRRPGVGVGRTKPPRNQEGSGLMDVPADHQLDTVLKTALTDFIKNAAMRLGRRLGGELYFDEKMAGVIGWEGASRPPKAHPPEDTPVNDDLGSIELRYGWGKEKKWQGMTLAEVYEDDDGRSAMAWCAEDESRQGSWLNQRMAKYYNIMMQGAREEDEGVPDGVSLEEYDESTTAAILGHEVVDTKLITYTLAQAINKELAKHIGDGKLFGHANHVVNHLKSHFDVAKVVDLTGEKARAFVEYFASNGKTKDPRWYSPEAGELFGAEPLDDVVKKAAVNLPAQWQNDPIGWLHALYKQFGIKQPISAKQATGMKTVLSLIENGSVNLGEIMSKPNYADDPMYKTFLMAMTGVAKDGQ